MQRKRHQYREACSFEGHTLHLEIRFTTSLSVLAFPRDTNKSLSVVCLSTDIKQNSIGNAYSIGAHTRILNLVKKSLYPHAAECSVEAPHGPEFFAFVVALYNGTF